MSITVQTLVNDFKMEVVSGDNGLSSEILNPQLTRPGIELAGLFDFFENDRIQIFGSKEMTFFGWLNEEDQEIRVDMMFQRTPPAFLFSKHVDIPEVFKRKGVEYNIPILKSYTRTNELFSRLYQYLHAKLAPRKSLHATLVDINGVGVLLRGKSGVGKSEVALELVKKGHQLVADDRVDVYEREQGMLIGEAPDLLKEYLEIRGIGIVNVVKLFGASAYRGDKYVSMIAELVPWDNEEDYDRLGLESESETIFETEVPLVKIPITAARSLPSLVEVAAMNVRLRTLGINMAEDFTNNISREINAKNSKNKNKKQSE